MHRSIVASLALLASAVAAAQQLPKRPALGVDADTNDAAAYAAWGAKRLDSLPAQAADAFYWAARIDPSSGAALYARWVALQLATPKKVDDHVERDRSTMRSADVRRMDSVELRALMRDPLAFRSLDGALLAHVEGGAMPHVGAIPSTEHCTQASGATMQGAGGGKMRPGTPVVIVGGEQTCTQTSYNAPAPKPNFALHGWAEYAVQQFPVALMEYERALSDTKVPWAIHAERARIFYLGSVPENAASEFELAAAALRANKAPELVYVYESAALYEHSRGLVLEELKQPDSAHAAYERALEDDPSWSPARIRLSALAMARGDTAGALAQLDIASRMQAEDGLIAYAYARALAQSGHAAEAVDELRRCVSLEPYYAAPRLLLSLIYDAAGMKPEAAAAYAAYLSVARRGDPQVAHAKQRIADLASAAPKQ